ncbi:hypothetical protein [Paenibacillus peoriae]|uniref:hypothetical protein n=1 Tax=Paenibacillus peoriae TaxID=59893 RepID=UPI00215A9284|nr:hypothetical protein [Paenibacillus peoriae]
MTDKPRSIDADKLIKWKDGERSAFYQSLYSSINDDDFDPDPPQQTDIQVGELNWAEVSRGLYNDFVAAQSLIQQKDAEIARLRTAIEKSIAEYELHEEPGAAAECMWQILYTHGTGDKL